MKAILLCAGYGKRLRPLTYSTPKCLVPICGKPLLEIWLEQLTNVGVKNFLINTHYLKENVEKFVNNSKFRDQIELVYEKKLLGTAGTLIKNYNFYKDCNEIMLIHADNYSITNFHSFIKKFNERPKECNMTMMTFKTNDIESSGTLTLKDDIVTEFFEKDPNSISNIANGAVYILSKTLFEWIKKENFSDFSKDVIPTQMNKINIFHNDLIHIDIGTLAKYELAKSICKKYTRN